MEGSISEPLGSLKGGCHITTVSALRLNEGKALNDLHWYDPSKRTWTEVDDASGLTPEARAFAGVAEIGGLMYIFGGSNGTGRS